MTNLSRSLLPGALVLAAALLPLAGACGSPASAPVAPSAVAVVAIEPTATASSTADAAPTCFAGVEPAPPGLADHHQDLLAGPADTAEPVKKACEKIAQRLARAEKDGPGTKDSALDHLGKCFSSPRGAWALDPGAATTQEPDADGYGGGWKVDFKVTYVTPDGRLVRSSKLWGDVASLARETHGASVEAVFDFDGDGVSELIVALFDSNGEEWSRAISVLTFRDGAVRAYAPAEGLDIKEVVDMDGDGRPDLMVPGPFEITGPCGLDGQQFGAPPHVAHSVAGGRFQLDDAVAQTVMRAQCGLLPEDLVAVERDKKETWVDAAETARRITCARIYGISAEAVARRVRSKYPYSDSPKAELPLDVRAPGFCMPLRSMLELAAQGPLFTTAPPCPTR